MILLNREQCSVATAVLEHFDVDSAQQRSPFYSLAHRSSSAPAAMFLVLLFEELATKDRPHQ